MTDQQTPRPADAAAAGSGKERLVMGTKNNPGSYDCYHNAEPDEPMFILLARDPMAPILVKLWADLREYNAGNPSKVAEARKCAADMDAWRTGRPK